MVVYISNCNIWEAETEECYSWVQPVLQVSMVAHTFIPASGKLGQPDAILEANLFSIPDLGQCDFHVQSCLKNLLKFLLFSF